MLEGWVTQQRSRSLRSHTIEPRLRLVRRRIPFSWRRTRISTSLAALVRASRGQPFGGAAEREVESRRSGWHRSDRQGRFLPDGDRGQPGESGTALVGQDRAEIMLPQATGVHATRLRSEEHTSELQSREKLVCSLL